MAGGAVAPKAGAADSAVSANVSAAVPAAAARKERRDKDIPVQRHVLDWGTDHLPKSALPDYIAYDSRPPQ